jgi:hypothetical protein
VGDFNRLKLTRFAVTHGVHTLDLCFTNRPDLFKCSVGTASAASDHKALIICGSGDDKIFHTVKPKS